MDSNHLPEKRVTKNKFKLTDSANDNIRISHIITKRVFDWGTL